VPRAQVIDLFEALKQSLEQAQGPGGGVKTSAAAASKKDTAAAGEETARPIKKAAPRKTRSRKAS
jgi:hypothetical protein